MNFERKCEICKRSDGNSRALGPLIRTASISAHVACVLYSPVMPGAESLAPPAETGIAGVSTRFIRNEGHRAAKLICDYCKSKGAHVGCCFDIGTDNVLKYCRQKYHIDCGLNAGASFSVSESRGTVSICFAHRDPLERAPEMDVFDQDDSESDGEYEYDVGQPENAVDAENAQVAQHAEIAEDIQNVANAQDAGQPANEADAENDQAAQHAEIAEDQRNVENAQGGQNNNVDQDAPVAQDPVGEFDADDYREELEYLEIEEIENLENSTASAASVKDELVKDEPKEENPLDLQMMNASIKSNDSDCVITGEYQAE